MNIGGEAPLRLKTRAEIASIGKMDNRQFLRTLDRLGTTEDMADILTYIAGRMPMTTDKLEALVYFAYAWGLVAHREIAPFRFIQTSYGPCELTCRKLWLRYDIVSQMDPPEIDDQLKAILDFVILRYGSMPTTELSDRMASHLKHIPPGSDITARDIYLYFSKAKS